MAISLAEHVVLDPRADQTDDRQGAGPDAGRLAGKTVGLKTDEYWFAWDWAAEEWEKALHADGAECIVYRSPDPKPEEAASAAASFAQFLDSVDIVVSGLCNCGGCTNLAVTAGVAALDRGIPTTIVATEHFERLARVLANDKGRSEVRMTLLPYPLEGRDEAEIRQIARDAYPKVLASLGIRT